MYFVESLSRIQPQQDVRYMRESLLRILLTERVISETKLVEGVGGTLFNGGGL